MKNKNSLQAHYLPILLMIISVVGCNKSDTENKRGPDSLLTESKSEVFSLKRITPRSTEESKKDAFATFKRVCDETGGNYLIESNTCDCGEGRSFGLSHSEYGCNDIQVRGEYLGINGLTVMTNTKKLAVTQMSHWIGMPNGPGGISAMVLVAYDEEKPFLEVSDAISLLAGQHSPDFALDRREGDLSFEDNAALLIPEIQTNEPFKKQIKQNVFSENANATLKRQVTEVMASLSQLKQKSKVLRISDSGCMGACEERAILKTASGLNLLRQKLYFGGGIFFNRISVLNEMGLAEMILVLTPQDDLNFVMKISNQSTSSYWHAAIDFYTPSLISLLKSPLVLDESLISSLPVKEAMIKDASSHSVPQIVLCEAGLHWEHLLYRGANSFILGPHSDESLWGWTRSKRALDTIQFGEPLLGMYFTKGFEKAQGLLNSHAASVLDQFSNDNKAQTLIAPLTPQSCAASDETWVKEILQLTHARVVNGSYSESYSVEACKNAPIAKKIHETHSSLLWVYAAGNEQQNLDEGTPTICPQLLVDEENLIKVASGSVSGIDSFSNRGYRSVDIVASGKSGDGKVGTSFAAPKVSMLAAKINTLSKAFLPIDVKYSILYSVNFNPHAPLQVTSGGEVNPTRALNLARFKIEHEPSSDLEWIQGFYCGKSTRSCNESKQRIKFWKKTGLWRNE